MKEELDWDPTRGLRTEGLDVLHAGVEHRGRTLLHGVLFNLHPGEVGVVVGPYNADREALVDMLIGADPLASGEILLGGKEGIPIGSVGYVPRDDGLHPAHTIRQALNAAAMLRLQWLTEEQRAARVEKLAAQVGLTNHLDRRIRHLDPGQTKWVAVALELLTDPFVLVLEDPTTELDEAADGEMMMALEKVARTGVVVIVVASEPMPSMSRSDALMVLYAGRVAYFGPPHEVFDYFDIKDLGEIYGMLTTNSPATWHQICRTSMWNSQYMSRTAPALTRDEPLLTRDQRDAFAAQAVPPAARQFARAAIRETVALLGRPLLPATAIVLAGALGFFASRLGQGAGLGLPSVWYLLGLAGFSSGCLVGALGAWQSHAPLIRERLYGLSIAMSSLALFAVSAVFGLLPAGFILVVARLTLVIESFGVVELMALWLAVLAGLGVGMLGATQRAVVGLAIFGAFFVVQMGLAPAADAEGTVRWLAAAAPSGWPWLALGGTATQATTAMVVAAVFSVACGITSGWAMFGSHRAARHAERETVDDD